MAENLTCFQVDGCRKVLGAVLIHEVPMICYLAVVLLGFEVENVRIMRGWT